MKQSIGNFLLRRLKEAGVEHIFGVPGDYNLELMQQLEERGDPADKRARLIKLTEKGREVLHHCYRQAGKVSDIVLSDLSEQDILLATQLLRGIEIKHAPLIFELRDKPLNEIYEKVVGRPPVETDWSKGHSSQP